MKVGEGILKGKCLFVIRDRRRDASWVFLSRVCGLSYTVSMLRCSRC